MEKPSRSHRERCRGGNANADKRCSSKVMRRWAGAPGQADGPARITSGRGPVWAGRGAQIGYSAHGRGGAARVDLPSGGLEALKEPPTPIVRGTEVGARESGDVATAGARVDGPAHPNSLTARWESLEPRLR
ncbi:hypothetical protein NDU88_006419 [Pleurodeles waltl]|uniref:Uncharacterized protein n=1 Tax=Pleurodeles waltl TaxID=8319 RepID=A0AAV7TE43_PLEWA|nr:hypothetical protein NDU88_006419 [Pleurodeles waltl]